ncbi:restriction endonuclease PLD domain-containing protein [Mycoplasma wenyonii]|uniref:restriction endonuclease PLD domain-containing protein n=1 Tax=Mycoplasma wenyonii TaxID=65123 RepID=UPI000310920E|nr:restriction endonuclease PLD domain-containing protein [Mycoplasma wenyonii]
MLSLKELEKSESLRTIVFTLNVPTREEVLLSTEKELDCTKHSLNACYSGLGLNDKSSSWYDVQLIVEGDSEDLPSKTEWFYIVTDDGYLFKARFEGKKSKKLNSFENTLLIGKWIKGRLAELGFVENFKEVSEDPKKHGIITQEMLGGYGGNQIFLKKTQKTKKDGKGLERDVWFMSFPFKL